MNRYTVTAHKIPTAYNDPRCFVVDAATEDDARALVKDALRDLSGVWSYTYSVKPYTPLPAGRIIGPIFPE